MSKQRIQELESKIIEARDNYYNHTPTISDQVFDAWIDELRGLDPANASITAIGAPVVPSEWLKAKHQIPMGSLDKVNLPEELSKWALDVANNDKLFVTEKLDGLSIELIYENGNFKQAITRGNGEIGEDISVNVVKMKGVPHRLPSKFTGSVRGEIFMKKSVHTKHFSDKANPRNAASGTSKRLDGQGTEYLDVFVYQVLGDVDLSTEVEQFKWCLNNGFSVPNYWLFSSVKEVTEHWREYQDTKRNELDYDIDGLVVRVNDLAKQMLLGDVNLRPKGARAFKFDNEARESIVRDIHWQIGNSGRLTPVATVDPVMLVGATVSRASLYNLAYINELGIDIGATVLVARANDVIPRIEEVIKGTGTVSKAPTHCPECAGKVEMHGENLVCTNTNDCQSQILGKIENWVSELNLLEWGNALLERLVQSGKVKTIADLYTLSVDDLASIDRMGKKSAKKCYDILHCNKELPLETFLGGLSIPMIGASTIKLIMAHGWSDLKTFFTKNAVDFEKVAGVGPVKAASLRIGLRENQQLILDLLKVGVSIKKKVEGKLSNKSICFTGSMVNKRPVLEKMAADAGADVKNSVSKGLNILVIADPNSTSSKAVTARKLGTTLLSEEDFLKLIS
jgi:DNA ligase (NAD+)